ncbi:MAG: crossover junction endodeoxyribonuclease RuvC [Alphaproteobacteria bacterium]|nr:crossover junction endodeoxyribonuclease RuvC [Alphaproteobacteria bacterium]
MTTRVLGIDPGLLHTGWAVVESHGQSRKYIASGVILPKPKLEMSVRLATIFQELTKICETFDPDECSIEIIFVNKNPKTTLLLGQARAAAIVAVANRGVPVYEYEPNVIKKALTGAGHADKTAVDKMVRMLLPNARPKTPDEADAIAIALAHTNMLKILK